MKKIFFIGDIVGRPGRRVVEERLKAFRERAGVDIVVANAENSAGGAGITAEIAKEILGYGVDGITLGDHVWDQRGFSDQIGGLAGVCRPANLPERCPGKTHLIIEKEGYRLGVFTVLGRTFMKRQASCPFEWVDRKLEELRGQVDDILVEIHAEATAEKMALGWYLDGRVGMIVGTHTHIPTADERVLPKGTAYITDVGMTGPIYSNLGTDIPTVIDVFLDGIQRRFPVAGGPASINGVLVTLDNGMALGINRVCISEEQ